MKLKRTLILLPILAVCAGTGCHADTSGDTQQMPATTKSTANLPAPASTMTPEARAAMGGKK